MDRNTEVTDFIEKQGEERKAMLQTLRELIEKAVPDVKEQFKWSRPVYSTKKDFCYLQENKKHVTLGFFNFTKVDDPQSLLEGTGKQMRHVKISKPQDIQAALFSKMIKQAAIFD